MELKNTQANLLKTLKNLYDLKSPPILEITGPFKELVDDLQSIKQHLDLLKPNKYLNSDKQSYFYDLPKIHQYLNDVSGANMNFKYDNNYKMNPLIKFNIDSLNNNDSLLQDLNNSGNSFTERKEPINLNWDNVNPDKSNTDFVPKIELVNLNWDSLNPDKSNTDFTAKNELVNLNWDRLNPDKSNTDFVAKNEKINFNWNDLIPDKSRTDFTQKNEKIFIDLNTFTPDKTHLDFTVKKIDDPDNKEIEKKILVIREELKELTKLLAKIKQSKLTLTNYTSDKYLEEIKNNVKNYIIIEASDYPEKAKINYSPPSYYNEVDKLNYHNFTLHNDENDFTQLGGFINIYLNSSTEYFNLLSEKDHLLKELKENIDKNNIDYIHYYYFQLFILKKMNKVSEVYQFITKPTLLEYCIKLDKLNEIISHPEKYILKSNFYANLYFKYFIIIKIVWVFLNAIKNKWTNNNNYKISVFNYNTDKNNNKEIAKYFLLFNLLYPILNRIKI
jgi:hypothetical protein